MDAQKISEAASIIKKVDLADTWFVRVDSERVLNRTVIIETTGDYTGTQGHGEAKHYLRLAIEQHRRAIFETARALANSDKLDAQDVIRAEVGL